VEQVRFLNRIGLTDRAEILGAARGGNATDDEQPGNQRQIARLGSFA
jgi:hypothetical protein